MSERFQFSQSKVKKWQQCPFAYHLRYVEGLQKKVKSRPLQFGIMIHEMLEAEAEGEDPFDKLNEFETENEKLFAAEREMYGEIIYDIKTIMTAYFDFYRDDKVKNIRYKKQNAEHWLEVPIDEDMLFVMKIDGLVRTPNKLRWILEHKTFKRTPSDDDRWRNLQSAVYLKACSLVGMKPFDGILWNYVHSKPPTIPQVLKNGGLSTRAINTLPSVVHKLIEEQGLDPKDCQQLIDRAEQNTKNYFFRVFTPVNSTRVDMIFNDFIDSARDMKDHHGKRKFRNIGMHCGWSCDFESICRSEMTGSDSDFIKEREYESRKEKAKGKDEARRK